MTPLQALPADMDPYDRARAEAMVIGYAATWDPIECEVLAVEREFRFPLVGHWHVGGKIDLVLRYPDGTIETQDHKTSGEDVSAGSTYRERLILNGQATQYLWGAESLGFNSDRFLFSVLSKPTLKPLLATPVEDRKYTKEKWRKCDACKGAGCVAVGCTDGKILVEPARLYATQRTDSETPREYRDRILKDIEASPADYYAQIPITRTEVERNNYTRSLHDDVALMDHVHEHTLHTPNDEGCFVGRSPCQFWPACSGVASIKDDTLFQIRKPSERHSELETPVPDGVQLITNSRRHAFNRCRRLEFLAYRRGYRAVKQSHHLEFGTAVHAALENYWRARMAA